VRRDRMRNKRRSERSGGDVEGRGMGCVGNLFVHFDVLLRKKKCSLRSIFFNCGGGVM
jgi:hypothetical protein